MRRRYFLREKSAVEGDETGHGGPEDGAEGTAAGFGGLAEDVAVVAGN